MLKSQSRANSLSVMVNTVIKNELMTISQQFETFIIALSNNFKNRRQKKSSQRTNRRKVSKNNIKAIQRLNLPFQVYAYSSYESDCNSPQDLIQFEESSASQKSKQRDNKCKISNSEQLLQNKFFSFAKNKHTDLVNRKICDQFKNSSSNQTKSYKTLKILLSQDKITQIISYLIEIYGKETESQEIQSSRQSKIERFIQSYIQDMMRSYYTQVSNQLIQKITEQYFKSIHYPSEIQHFDEKIYFKRQQLEIKKNQLDTLQNIMAEIKNNRKITQLSNQVSNETKIKKTGIVNVNKNLIPSLNFNGLRNSFSRQNQREQQGTKLKKEKALTSRKQKEKQSDRSHKQQKIEKESSRAGRTYYYQNEKQSTSRKNSSQRRIYTQNMINEAEQRQQKLKESKEQNKKQQHDSVTKLIKQNIESQIRNILNQHLKMNPQNFNKQTNPNKQQNKPQQTNHQLKQQYKQNIQTVISFEIQHLKQRLDLVTKQIQAVDIQFQHKFKPLEVQNQLNQMKLKQGNIKKKLKSKIKEFWKLAQIGS